MKTFPILTADQLKTELQAIRDRDFVRVADQDAFVIVQQILDHLGSPDPVLRDDLGFSVLGQWIYRQKLLTPDQLRQVLQRVTGPEGLFRQIGEKHTDSVFWRSFSSLVVALVLAVDHQQAFLDQTEYRELLSSLVRYCQSEQDVRGYVPESGWAHAAAHIADALDECVQSRFATLTDCMDIWKGIRALLLVSEGVYGAEEDERMTTPLTAMIERQIVPITTLIEWLAELPSEDRGVVAMVRRINSKHLVRSVYFRLRKENLLGESEGSLLSVLDQLTL